VAAPRGGFVDGDPRDAGGVGARSRLIDVVMDHAPQICVVLAAILATALTGMAETMVITIASNSRVKPLSGRAHGAAIFLTPHFSQRTRGTRAFR
jgi:hypothetical protein